MPLQKEQELSLAGYSAHWGPADMQHKPQLQVGTVSPNTVGEVLEDYAVTKQSTAADSLGLGCSRVAQHANVSRTA